MASSLGNAFSGKGKLTSAQFVALFKKYDRDGNGHIDKTELDALLIDVLKDTENPSPSPEEIRDLKQKVLEKYDTNFDGKLEMNELALMLPTEDNFLNEFRNEVANSIMGGKSDARLTSVEFLKIWYHYDKDRSGYLEIDELEGFLRDLLLHNTEDKEKKQTSPFKSLFKKLSRRFFLAINPQMINGYRDTIIELYDTNRDGKIELAELSKLLPVEENFLCQFASKEKSLSKEVFNDIFSHYDRDGNGEIESEELIALMKDVLEREGSTIDLTRVQEQSKIILEVCDTNKDGKLNREELGLLFSKH
ncbi:calretinin-like isoform X2 [Lineus longissimus]|uniref:calretinin-like isoform X2 n=1 Tax=Lineus longissimus TaxID=88925 RepID=UPI002B4F209E